MINVPQETAEKPLTPVDYIAALDGCDSTLEVGIYCEQVPMVVSCDDRFARAVASKLQKIGQQRRSA
jgi:hypothetical protein